MILQQPSPPERKSFWQRTTSSTSSHRGMLSDNEPFSISRESFESYRRSFVRPSTNASGEPALICAVGYIRPLSRGARV